MGYMKRNPPTSKPRPKAGPLPPKSIKDEIERCGRTIVGLSRRVCQLDEELAKKDFENMELQKAVQSWKDNATFWHKETKSNKFRQIAVDTQKQLSMARKMIEELLAFEEKLSSIDGEALKPFKNAREFLKETDNLNIDIPEEEDVEVFKVKDNSVWGMDAMMD